MSKWEMVRLGDVFPYIRNGANLKQNKKVVGFPITRIESISEGTINRNKMGYAGIMDLEPYSSFVLQEGDILMSHINSATHLGKVARYTKRNEEKIIHGMNLLNLRTDDEKATSRFAYYFFISYGFKKQIPNITKHSVNQSSFNITALKDLWITLPPLGVQHKIANILDRAAALIEKRKAQIARLDLLVKSQFVEMFGDPVINPMGWEQSKWKLLFDTTTGKLDSNAMDENGIYPFFTCAKEVYTINDYAFDCEALLLAGNNASAIYDVKHYSGKFNAYQRTYVLTLKNNQHSYHLFKLMLEQKLEQMRVLSKGTNTKYLTMGILNDFDFICPPHELQHQFANFVRQTEKLKAQMKQRLRKLKLLYKSLMQKYFKGDLA